MSNILITGGNKGIGFALCRQLRDQGHQVFASSRKASPDLEEIGVQILDGIELTDPDCGLNLASQLEQQPLDMLINNAGILTRETFDDLNFDRIEKQFQVNTLAPLRIIHALQNNLQSGGKIGIVTSRVGSMGDNSSGGIYGYRISKAAANMVGVNLAHEMAGKGIAVALLHPGLVATEMTGRQGIDPETAAAGLIQRMEDLSMETTGKFWHAEGYELPW